ncbi:uncharacterized protein LOC135848373 [Planococcus citri]|uniref:uncharacterized protein LOC135848373 n=1 Tax=Planococcus citri TaxID=170843 RepID=UPI0031F8297D
MWRQFDVRIGQFLLTCPFCEQEFNSLADSFEHVLKHLTLDKLHQAKLIKWLSLKLNNHDNVNANVNHVRPQTQLLRTEEFIVNLPVIDNYTKCLFCEKFVVNNIMNHIFDHFEITTRRILIELWFTRFLQSDASYHIVQSCCEYINSIKTQRIDTSSLLVQLPLFVNPSTNTCRYCGMVADDPASLYGHYVEWHSELPVKYHYCIICNYKTRSNEDLADHALKERLKCPCGRKFRTLVRCLKHVKSCEMEPDGVCCPFCQGQTSDEMILRKHISNACKPFAAANDGQQSDNFVNLDDIKEFILDEQCLQIGLEMQNLE